METRLSEKPTPDFWNRTVFITLTFVSSPRVLVGGCDEKKIRDYVVWLVRRVFLSEDCSACRRPPGTAIEELGRSDRPFLNAKGSDWGLTIRYL